MFSLPVYLFFTIIKSRKHYAIAGVDGRKGWGWGVITVEYEEKKEQADEEREKEKKRQKEREEDEEEEEEEAQKGEKERRQKKKVAPVVFEQRCVKTHTLHSCRLAA